MSDRTMHWLESQMLRLRGLAEAFRRATESLHGQGAQPSEGSVAQAGSARRSLLAGLRLLVEEVAGREGVTICFACHDGLPVAAAGRAAGRDLDALAAAAQRCLDQGRAASALIPLGELRQLVVVGDTEKLALLALGQLAIGILAPIQAPLTDSLA